jgi:hypothetical protein
MMWLLMLGSHTFSNIHLNNVFITFWLGPPNHTSPLESKLPTILATNLAADVAANVVDVFIDYSAICLWLSRMSATKYTHKKTYRYERRSPATRLRTPLAPALLKCRS